MNTFKVILLTAPLCWPRKKMKHSFNLLLLLNSTLFCIVRRNHSISGDDGKHGNHDTASADLNIIFFFKPFLPWPSWKAWKRNRSVFLRKIWELEMWSSFLVPTAADKIRRSSPYVCPIGEIDGLKYICCGKKGYV